MNDQFVRSEKDPKDDGRIDWMFVVWNPQSWYHLYNDPKSTWDADDPHFRQPLAPPTLEVCLGGEGGQVDWSKIDAAGKLVGEGNISLFPIGGERIGKWSGSTQIRTDGTFAFDGVPPGRYQLSTDPRAVISSEGVKTKEIEVTAGKTIEIDVPAMR
jgi:hypothetical protein